jgi:hypothetical protein
MRGELAALLETAEAISHEVGSRPGSPEAVVAHRLSGMTNWWVGNFIEGRAQLERALAIFDRERDRDLAFRVGQDIGVSAMAHSALVLWSLATAQKQKARSFELRAAMSMARLWRDEGKSQQARELLAPVYGWFTEDFDTLDLKEAKNLLVRLDQRG